jgi:Domain of unknown function (DUF4338)
MDVVLRYRGRTVTDADVAFIANLIAHHPEASRRALSRKLCEAWQWVQPNGTPCDLVCRGLMLALHRGGHIVLPSTRTTMPNPLAVRRPPTPVELPEVALCAPLREIGPLTIQQVRRTPAEALVIGLIERYHYLRYVQPVGEHLKYLVTAGGQPIACLAWSSAPLYLSPRDRHIGWSSAARQRNLRLVAYQSRFLILPWVKVPHLASHLLGRMARQLSADWERVYAHPIYFTETFVDPSRYRGTCYRAANWTYLGMTAGRGKDAPTRRPTRPPKMVFGYPLVKDFQRRLCATG